MKNKRAPILTPDVVAVKPKQGGNRALRASRRKQKYAAQFARTAANKVRKIARHKRAMARHAAKAVKG